MLRSSSLSRRREFPLPLQQRAHQVMSFGRFLANCQSFSEQSEGLFRFGGKPVGGKASMSALACSV